MCVRERKREMNSFYLPDDFVVDSRVRLHLKDLRFDGGDLKDLLHLLGVEVAQTKGLHKT